MILIVHAILLLFVLISCGSRCLCTRTSVIYFGDRILQPSRGRTRSMYFLYRPSLFSPLSSRAAEIAYGLFSKLPHSLSALNEPVNPRRFICSTHLRRYCDRNVGPAFEGRRTTRRMGHNRADNRVGRTRKTDIVVLIPFQVVIGYTDTRTNV